MKNHPFHAPSSELMIGGRVGSDSGVPGLESRWRATRTRARVNAVGGCGGRAWWEGVWDHIGGIEDRTIVPSVFIFQLGRFEKVYLSYFT